MTKCPNRHDTKSSQEGDAIGRTIAGVFTLGVSEVLFATFGTVPPSYKDVSTDPWGNQGVGYGNTPEEARANADANLDAGRNGIVKTRES